MIVKQKHMGERLEAKKKTPDRKEAIAEAQLQRESLKKEIWATSKYAGKLDTQKFKISYKAKEDTPVYDGETGDTTGKLKKGETFRIFRPDIRVVGTQKYILIENDSNMGWIPLKSITELGGREKEVERTIERGKARDRDRLKRLEREKKLILSESRIDVLETKETRLAPEVARHWVNSNSNENWTNIDAKGRENVMNILRQPPFRWSANKLKECIQRGSNDFITFNDLVGSSGLNLGGSSEVIGKYQGLLKQNDAYLKSSSELQDILVKIEQAEKTGKSTSNLLTQKHSIEARFQKAKQKFDQVRTEFEKYSKVLHQCYRLLKALSPEKFYYNPQKRVPEEVREHKRLTAEASTETPKGNISGPYSYGNLQRPQFKEDYEAKDKEPRIHISEAVFKAFVGRLEKDIFAGKEQEFDNRDLEYLDSGTVLKLIVRIYGYERLVKDKFLVKDPASKALYLKDIPESFKTLTNPHIRALLASTHRNKDKKRYEWNRRQEMQVALSEAQPKDRILRQLDYVFGKHDRGPRLEETGRPIQMVDLDGKTYTVDTNEFARYTSGKAAYTHTRDQIFTSGNPEQNTQNTYQVLNRFTLLSLINSGHEVDFERIRLDQTRGDLERVLPEETRQLIRKGYTIDQALRHAQENAEYEGKYSTMPQLQALGEQIRGKYPEMPDREIKAKMALAERKLKFGVILGVTNQHREGIGGIAGLSGGLDLGHGLDMQISVSALKRSPIRPIEGVVGASAGYNLRPTENSQLRISIGGLQMFDRKGGTAMGVGPNVDVTLPLTDSLDISTGVGVMAGLSRESTVFQILAGGRVGFSWNPDRLARTEINEKMKKHGFDKIEDAENKYAEIMANPKLKAKVEKFFALYQEQQKAKGLKPLTEAHRRAIALETYDFIRLQLENGVIENLDAPFIQEVGVTFPIWGVAIAAPVIPYLAITIGQEKRVIRVSNPETEEIPDAIFRKSLEDQLRGQNTSFRTLSENGEQLALDEEGRPRIVFNKEKSHEVKDTPQIEALNASFRELGLDFSRGPDGLIKVTVDKENDANLKIHLDKELGGTHLVHDENSFYLALPPNQMLFITRRNLKYPFEHEGAFKETELFFKADTGNDEVIRSEETAMLRRTVDSNFYESGPQERLKDNKIITYQEYMAKKRSGSLETVEAFDTEGYREATREMQEAISLKDAESPIRPDLATIAEDFYTKDPRRNKEIKLLITENGSGTDFSKILITVNKYLVSKGQPELRGLERIMFVNKLMELTFRELKVDKRKRREILEHDLGFIERSMQRSFAETSEKPYAAKMAKYIVAKLKAKAYTESDQAIPINRNTTGSLFLSVVGTQRILGVRRSLDYESNPYKLLASMNFSMTSGKEVERRIARATLELLSPCKHSEQMDSQRFLNQPLAIKVARFIPILFPKEQAVAIARMYKLKTSPTVSETYKKAYARFTKLVMHVRAAEMAGKKQVDLGSEYGNTIIFINAHVTGGLFEKCGNYTMVGKETLTMQPMYAGESKDRQVQITPEMLAHFDYLNLLTPFITFGKQARACKQTTTVVVNHT